MLSSITLPNLFIFSSCLDEWFQRNRCCPEHPEQAPQEYIETLPRNSARSNRLPISPRLGATTIIDTENDNDNLLSPLVANSLPANLNAEHSPILEIDVTNSPSPSTSSYTSPDIVGGYSGQQNTHSPIQAISRSIADDDEGGSPSPRETLFVEDDPPRTIVHVDEGSIHGTTSLFDDEELAELTSKKLKILVSENSMSSEVDNT